MKRRLKVAAAATVQWICLIPDTKMPAEGKVFRLTEVAEHNKAKGEDKSIWTVIHDKVYDITKFLDEVHNDDAICNCGWWKL